ncbi:retrovirus-related pol polyprotein from transposon TNT 1-94 [Tanacetum coccineum]
METNRTLGESNSIRDSCLVALQNKQTEFERYKAFNDRIVDYDKLERKVNETIGLLAQKEIDIKEGLKVKAYEISVVKEKHDELVKQSLLTKSHYEGLVKEKTKVITDLKLKEEKDIDKMISMENQIKFLNEIVYKRSQSIQTIHMLAPKCPTFNGRPTFANPRYLKKAQNEMPCLYALLHDQFDPANRLVPDREDTLTLDNESRSKLNKDFLSEQTDFVSKEIYTELLQRFARLEKHSISLEIALQECQVQLKNDTVCKERASNVFRKEREQYVEIQDLKAQMQDKNMAIKIYVFLLENFLGNDLHPVIVDLISIQYPFKVETSSSTPICLLAKASPTQAWLWHRRLSHLNFDYINLLSKKDIVIGLPKLKYVKDQLCSSCEVSKAKRSSFKSKTVPSSKGRLNLLHMDLCGPMRLLSINGTNKSGLIVETTSDILGHSFSSKDETPEVLKDFLTMIQRNLQAPVISVRTDRGTEFLNKTLNAFFKEEGIEHQTSTPRTPEQNGVVERRNRTLVEAARTMLSASKLPLFFWAEAIATAAISKQINPHPQLHEKQHTTTLMTKTLKQTPSHLWLYMVPLTRDG